FRPCSSQDRIIKRSNYYNDTLIIHPIMFNLNLGWSLVHNGSGSRFEVERPRAITPVSPTFDKHIVNRTNFHVVLAAAPLKARTVGPSLSPLSPRGSTNEAGGGIRTRRLPHLPTERRQF